MRIVGSGESFETVAIQSLGHQRFAAVTTGGREQHTKRGVVANRARAGVTKEKVRGAGMNAAEAEIVVGGRPTAASPNGVETVGHIAARPASKLTSRIAAAVPNSVAHDIRYGVAARPG